MQISEPKDQDTPKRQRLKRVVFNLATSNELKAKKIKVLHQNISHKKKNYFFETDGSCFGKE